MRGVTEVEYIESGSFQGSEEHVSRAGINYHEDCFVVKKSVFKRLKKALKFAKARARYCNVSVDELLK